MDSFQPKYGGGSSDAFLTKLAPDGSSMVYSTYIGGPVAAESEVRPDSAPPSISLAMLTSREELTRQNFPPRQMRFNRYFAVTGMVLSLN